MFLRKIAVFLLVGMICPGWVAAESSDTSVTRLDEIVVTGTRTEHTLKDVPVETVVVTREDIERSTAQTVTDILKTIPGFSTAVVDDLFGSWTAMARMRGLNFNNGYGLVLIDGQRIHGTGQSGAHGEYAVGLNQIPVSMIDRIEVVKGPGSVLYGSDAMVGVINIITRNSPAQDSGGAGVAYGWYDVKERVNNGVTTKPTDEDRNQSEAYVYYGGRISEQTGYLIHYTHEYSESNYINPGDNNRDSVMAKFDTRLSDQVDFWGKGELSKFDGVGYGATSTFVENCYRLSAGMTWKPSTDHIVNLKGYHYVDDFDNESSTSHPHGNINYDQIEVQYTTNLTANQLVTAGAEFQRQTIDYVIDNTGSARTTVLEDVDTISVYLQDELTLFEDLVVVPGVRYDNHSTFGDSFNPKISLMYRLLDATTFRGSVGKSFKSPTIRQLYYDVPYYHSPFYMKSNPDLDPETSIGYQFGVEQWFYDGRIVLNATYYRNDVKDMVVTDVSGETYNGAELYVYRNVEEAMTQGIECSARMQFSPSFLVQASYAYSDTENKETGMELTLVPEHEFNLMPSYDYDPLGVGISATLSWLSKQYTDSANTTELDSYMVVDAKVYKKLGSNAKLSFEADNLFDSDKGDKTYYFYRTGRTFTLKLDFAF